jgi:hypothetical protein
MLNLSKKDENPDLITLTISRCLAQFSDVRPERQHEKRTLVEINSTYLLDQPVLFNQ